MIYSTTVAKNLSGTWPRSFAAKKCGIGNERETKLPEGLG